MMSLVGTFLSINRICNEQPRTELETNMNLLLLLATKTLTNENLPSPLFPIQQFKNTADLYELFQIPDYLTHSPTKDMEEE